MNVMLMTLVFIKINDLNIFFILLKMTLIMNGLKLNELLRKHLFVHSSSLHVYLS